MNVVLCRIHELEILSKMLSDLLNIFYINKYRKMQSINNKHKNGEHCSGKSYLEMTFMKNNTLEM